MTQINWEYASGTFAIILFIAMCSALICFKVYKTYDVRTQHIGNVPIPVGGWLTIPVVHTVLASVILVSFLCFMVFISGKNKLDCFDRLSENYNPASGWVMILEMGINTIRSVLYLLVLTLLARKRSSFPVIFIVAVVIQFLYSLSDFVLLTWANAPVETIKTAKYALILASVYSGIWIPYMIKSERVKQTFTQWYPS